MKVRRHLSVFSNQTDQLIEDYELVDFDLDAFREHFDKNRADPLLYYDHEVEPQHTEFLARFLPRKVNFDFDRFAYIVSCTSEPD